mmetsp:Transcript_99642/g.284850  ORF Transcript_99642/g.284850 Transcript_99642/m.284850 type:complete len:830 (-) Transcript_99642:114-2603(-)
MAEAACAAKPGDASSHVHLGMLKEDRIDFDGAETAYNAAIAADPGYATCAGLGVIAEDAGNFDAAEAHYRAAIAADPTNSNARFILAGFLEKRAEKSGDLADAAMIYDECAQLYTVSDGVDCELTRSVQQKAHTARMTVWCDEVRPSGASQCLGLLHGEDEYTSEQAAYMLSFARRRGGSLKFLPADDAPRPYYSGTLFEELDHERHEKHERYKRYRHITTFEEVDAALYTGDPNTAIYGSTIDINNKTHNYSGCLMESDDLVFDVASRRCTLFEPAPVAGQDKEEDTDSEGGETSRHKLRLPREIYPMQREVKTTGSALDLRANKKAVQALGLPPVQLAGAHPFVVPVRFQRLHLRMRVADAELNGLGSNPLAKTTRQFRLWAGRVGFNVHAEMSDKGRALRQHPNAGGIVAVCSVNSLRERPYIPGTSVTDTWIDSLRDPGYLDDWHTREPSQWALSSQRVVEAKRWLDLPDAVAFDPMQRSLSTPTLSSRQVEQLLIRFDHQNDETVREIDHPLPTPFGTRPWDFHRPGLGALRDVHWADVMSCDNALAKIAEELDAAATHVERGTFIPTGPRSIVVSTSDCTKAVEHWFAVTYDIDRKGEEELAALDIGPAVTSMEATPAPSSATPPSKAQGRKRPRQSSDVRERKKSAPTKPRPSVFRHFRSGATEFDYDFECMVPGCCHRKAKGKKGNYKTKNMVIWTSIDGLGDEPAIVQYKGGDARPLWEHMYRCHKQEFLLLQKESDCPAKYKNRPEDEIGFRDAAPGQPLDLALKRQAEMDARLRERNRRVVAQRLERERKEKERWEAIHEASKRERELRLELQRARGH